MHPLGSFMNERMAIHTARENGAAKPWTRDKILQSYRFCNIYRELDTTTQWIAEHVRKPYRASPNLWFMLALCRQINWVPTLRRVFQGAPGGFGRSGYSPAILAQAIEAEKEFSGKSYTSAYMLTAGGASGGMRKSTITSGLILGPLWNDRDIIANNMLAMNSMEATTNLLSAYYGFGPFVSYEVACDLRYCPGWLDDAPDLLTWSNPGPGARRGLNRLAGRDLDTRLTVKECVREMRTLLDVVSLDWRHNPELELREIEHSLCEFDKYERVRLGQGTPRQKYNGL